jgi:hypothetical protein
MSEKERYQRQYTYLHKIQRELSEAGVKCQYKNRAITDGTTASPFSVYFSFGSMSNGETVMELCVYVGGETYKGFGNGPSPERGLEEIKATHGTASTVDKFAEFAGRINPTNLGFSPKMTAIVGAIIGHDYGVRDRKGGLLTGLSITSDGYVICSSTASDGGGAFIGSAADLERNIEAYRFELASQNDEDAEEFERLYNRNVKDWRK